MDGEMRQQVMINQFIYVTGCHPEQARQILTESNWQVEMALSIFFQESVNTSGSHLNGCHYPLRTPANTPVTPPNFPDALAALAKLSTAEGGLAAAMFSTSPPAPNPPMNQSQTSTKATTIVPPTKQN